MTFQQKGNDESLSKIKFDLIMKGEFLSPIKIIGIKI
jgi:hypothetical protein